MEDLFTHSQFICAIGVEGRAGTQAVKAAPIYLTEMSQQVGQCDVRSRGQTAHGDEQVVVGNGGKSISLNHVAAYTRDPEVPRLPQERRSWGRTAQNSN